jgi:hypothetical protein
MRLFANYLNGSTVVVESITAVYNPVLTTSFLNAWNVTSQRLTSSPLLFKQTPFANFVEERNSVLAKYESLVANCDWNDNLSVPIIPCCHGTGRFVAEKIAETGFAALSSLDAGYYGKGIYFTSYAVYAISYCCSQSHPALVLSWIFPGNVYAVVEKPMARFIAGQICEEWIQLALCDH